MDKMQKDIHFYTAFNLDKHPIRYESKKNIRNYLAGLYYYTKKYSNEEFNNMSSKGLFERYCEKLLGVKLSEDQLKNLKFRTKGSKLFTYRYLFIVDNLIISAFNDREKGRFLLKDIKKLFNKRNHKKLEEIYSVLYEDGKINRFKICKSVEGHLNLWKLNKGFIEKPISKVMVTANMSAGKSTMVNAIVGKSLAETQSGACTATINSYFNKVLEDNFINRAIESNSSSTYMRLMPEFGKRLCLIDTPGVNSSLNQDHREVTHNFIKSGNYDKLIYVLNATNLGSNDDISHIKKVVESKREVIFALNKLDLYRLGEDSIEDSIDRLKDDLLKLGVNNPKVCPVASYPGFLLKKFLGGIKITEDEEFELEGIVRKFNRPEYNLSKYYDFKPRVQREVCIKARSFKRYSKDQLINCLVSTGVPSLEEVILNR